MNRKFKQGVMGGVLLLPLAFLLTLSVIFFCTNFSTIWFYGEDNPNTMPAVNQANLQIFYRSFLDDTLPPCNNGFLDKKNYLNPPCHAKSFKIGDTVKCIDRLFVPNASQRNIEEQSMPYLMHFIFVGDSTIRQHFYNFLKFLPDYDLEYDPPIGSKREKIHMDANVTSRILNFRASFHWEPRFSNRTSEIFSQWTSKDDVAKLAKVIVIGMSLHHIMHLQEDKSQYSKFKKGLTELMPILQRVAKHNKVIWVK